MVSQKGEKIIKWIVFDLDDTLYLERDYVYSGFRAVSRYIGEEISLPFDEVLSNLVSNFEKGVRGTNFNVMLEEFGLPPLLLEKLIEIYRNHEPEIELLNGMRELLVDLSGRTRLAIITDGYLNSQRAKVEALEIGNLFQRIIYTDEFGRDRWKPNPYAFEKLRELEGIGEKEAVYIGDNPVKDFAPAKKSGFISIRMIHPGALHAGEHDIEGSEPDYTVKSVTELKELLEPMIPLESSPGVIASDKAVELKNCK